MSEPTWLTTARKEIGVKEIEGGRHNPRILEYHQATTLKADNDETAWCSAFANWCFQQVGMKGTGSAAARSWLNLGTILSVPRLGCVVVLRRGNSTWQGHVGFFLREEGNRILVFGGNQGDAVNEAWFPKSQLLGYRWPSEENK